VSGQLLAAAALSTERTPWYALARRLGGLHVWFGCLTQKILYIV
jgi:hypothetical protein